MERKDLLTSFHTFTNTENLHSHVWQRLATLRIHTKWQDTNDEHSCGRTTRFGVRLWIPCPVCTPHIKVSEPNTLLLKKYDGNYPIAAQKKCCNQELCSTRTQISASLRGPVIAFTMSRAPQGFPQGTVGRHSTSEHIPRTGTGRSQTSQLSSWYKTMYKLSW